MDLDLRSLVAHMARNLGEEFPAPPHEMKMRQALKLAEEAGEAVKAFCRYVNISRTPGALGEVEDELADVVLSAYMLAHYLGGDLDAALTRKSNAGYLRGWRGLRPTDPPQVLTDWTDPTQGTRAGTTQVRS